MANQPSRVLVVDDEADILGLVMAALRHSGYEVTGACSGHEALALLRTETVDLVVLDVLMPGTSGLEVLARLRADTTLHQPLVLLLSTLSSRAELLAAPLEAADGFMNKPFSILDLRDRVADLLRPLESMGTTTDTADAS